MVRRATSPAASLATTERVWRPGLRPLVLILTLKRALLVVRIRLPSRRTLTLRTRAELETANRALKAERTQPLLTAIRAVGGLFTLTTAEPTHVFLAVSLRRWPLSSVKLPSMTSVPGPPFPR